MNWAKLKKLMNQHISQQTSLRLEKIAISGYFGVFFSNRATLATASTFYTEIPMT